VRALIVALALVAGCEEVLPVPDFGSVRPLCPATPPDSFATCDPISEPYCAYLNPEITCSCVTSQGDLHMFVCAPPDMALGD
jgi:hypothetical protein